MRSPSTAERLALLGDRPILRGLSLPVLQEIDAALEWVHVEGGAPVVQQGDRNVPLILVVQGGLRASWVDRDGHHRVVFECFRGASAGEALVLTGQPSPFDLHAIRDSDLLYLPAERFNQLAARYPQLALSFARFVTVRHLEQLNSPEFLGSLARKTDRLPRSVALLTVGGDRVRRSRDLLTDALSKARVTTRLGIHEARDAFGGAGWGDGDVLRQDVTKWIDDLDSTSELLLFECELANLSWVDFCLRQADRIMVLVDDQLGPGGGTEPDWWRNARLEERPAHHLELVIVHRSGTEPLQSLAPYMRLPGVARLHHVKGEDRTDAERLARWLLDRPVGLVLGGGGALGIAHVGALKALEEARIPIDIVGGTSMGAIFAGGVARGWSADRIMEEVRALFARPLALYDFTIPLTSLLAGKKLERILQRLFGDLTIEELRVPYFCVSTDISHACPFIHDTGRLRDAIRASCSVPGLFPPDRVAEQILVDGGLIDNLPVDVMSERCPGPIIAVDVMPYPRSRDGVSGRTQSLRGRLSRRLRPLAEGATPLFDILMRSTFVASQRATETSLRSHPPALCLSPQLTKFGLLQWRACDALFDAGYACARRELESGTFPRSLWEGRVGEGPS